MDDRFFTDIYFFLSLNLKISFLIWAFSLGWLLLALRIRKVDPVQIYVSRKFWPYADLRFFRNIRRTYERATGKKFVSKLNEISFFLLIFGIVGYFFTDMIESILK